MSKMKLLLAMLAMVCFVGMPLLLADQENETKKPLNSETRSTILDKPVGFIFTDVPLDEAMESVSKQVGFPIVLDLNGLDLADVSTSTRVSGEAYRRPLKGALADLLAPLKLTVFLKSDVLLITDLEDTGAQMVTKVYPVADLVPGLALRDLGDVAQDPKPLDAATQESRQKVLEPLAAIIRTDVVAANQHSTVDPYPKNNALVVTAIKNAHEGVEKQLATMRKYKSIVLPSETSGERKKD